MTWSVDQILRMRRIGAAKGGEMPPEAIRWFVKGVVSGEVSRPQAAAFLAFTFLHGMTDAESAALTQAMTDSGDRLSWPHDPSGGGSGGELIDKHSTGGVGDKVSLILAPLWAELGMRVPMISGRGLGHTGGTLDKLEAIPGYRTDLSVPELRRVLSDVGCFISGQTAQLAPADRVLYALRNETQTVECIPLIVASILSKKLAEGLDRLVLDVKTGSGAFMAKHEDARRLAQAMVRVGNLAGVRTSAMITDMEQPLGEMCGNALEVVESVECLQGGGPADLRALVLELAGHPDAERVLDSGAAYERFARMCAAQGGDLSRISLRQIEREVEVEEIRAERAGWVRRCDAYGIGVGVFRLGAGRLRAEDPVDHRVGARVLVKVGDRVEVGQPVVRLYHAGRGVGEARELCAGAVEVGESMEGRRLVLERIG